MNNKIISCKIDTNKALEDAYKFFDKFGVNQSVLKKAKIHFHTPTRIDNVYGKNLLYLNFGITTANLPFNTKILALCSTTLLILQVYIMLKFPKEVKEEAFYSSVTKSIHISLLQESTNKLSSLLIHELTHYLSQMKVGFNKRTDTLARTLELYYLCTSNNAKSIEEALLILNRLDPKSCYSKEAFLRGFKSDDNFSVSLWNKLAITIGENYKYGMFIAGKAFKIYLNESEEKANIFLINLISLLKTESLSGIIKSCINRLAF